MAKAGAIGIKPPAGLTARPGKLPTTSIGVVDGSADGVGGLAPGAKARTGFISSAASTTSQLKATTAKGTAMTRLLID